MSSVLVACSDASDSPASSALDASTCGTPGACKDAASDAPIVPGSDAAPDDATLDHAVPPEAGSQDASDASDAALAADVDQNCAHYATQATTSPTSVRITNGHGTPPVHRLT